MILLRILSIYHLKYYLRNNAKDAANVFDRVTEKN